MSSEQAVMGWFKGWQSPESGVDVAGCFHEELRFEAPDYTFTRREQLLKFVKSAPNPWDDVELIASHFSTDKAAILYEGRNASGRMRVAEFFRVRDGRISEVRVVYSNMPADG